MKYLYVYDDNQQPASLKWTVQSPRQGRIGFALPCNIDAVFVKLTEQRIMATAPESRRQQAIRTSWWILKDWVDAQMALLETGMVTMDEIFALYALRRADFLPGPRRRRIQGPEPTPGLRGWCLYLRRR